MRTGGTTGGLSSLKSKSRILSALDSHGVSIRPVFFARKIINRLIQRIRSIFVRMPRSVL